MVPRNINSRAVLSCSVTRCTIPPHLTRNCLLTTGRYTRTININSFFQLLLLTINSDTSIQQYNFSIPVLLYCIYSVCNTAADTYV